MSLMSVFDVRLGTVLAAYMIDSVIDIAAITGIDT
jgi:hypothetical protein